MAHQTVNIPNSYNTIPLLTGSNYNTWKESIDIVLGCMKLDIALREPEPPKPSSESKEEEKAHYKAWTESNIMCLKIMKYAISEAMKGAMPNTDKAKDFLTEIGKRFTKSEKAELCSLLSKLIRATYNGKGNIREFIIEQIQVVSKIRNLGLKFDDNQLVYLIMISLPPQYSTFQVNFNTIKDKWTLDELISQCVQEEERLAKQDIVHNVNFITPGQGRKWKNKKRKQNSEKGSSDSTGGNQPQSKGKAKKGYTTEPNAN